MRTSSNIDKRDGLHSLLMRVTDIVELFSRRDATASAQWLSWLHDAETTLKEYNRPESAQLAGLRSSIIVSQMSQSTVRACRRCVDEKCVSTINPAQNIISALHNNLDSKLEAVHVLFRQILIPMRINNMIVLDGINDMTDYINSLLRQLSLNEQLSTNINGAVASIGKADTVRLIATVLTEEI